MLSVRSYHEFCGVIANAVELCLPVYVLEGGVVVLVCLDMRVARGKAEVSAVNQDVLENIGMPAVDSQESPTGEDRP